MGATPPKQSTTVGELGTGLVYIITWFKGLQEGHATIGGAILHPDVSDKQDPTTPGK